MGKSARVKSLGRIPVYRSKQEYLDGLKKARKEVSMSKLDERLAQIKSQFDAKQAEFAQLVEQKKAIDQRLGVLQADLLQLKGKYDGIEELKRDDEGPAPVPAPGPDEGAKPS